MLCPGGSKIHNVDTGLYKFHQNMKKNEVMVIKEVEEQIMLWKKVQDTGRKRAIAAGPSLTNKN